MLVCFNTYINLDIMCVNEYPLCPYIGTMPHKEQLPIAVSPFATGVYCFGVGGMVEVGCSWEKLMCTFSLFCFSSFFGWDF